MMLTQNELYIIAGTALAFFFQALMMLGLARRLRKAEAAVKYLKNNR